MGPASSKKNQLRVRVTTEERALLEKLCQERNSGETISDLVREAIALLIRGSSSGAGETLSPSTKTKVERLAILLKREPRQVEDACVEGILDLIEHKCEVPLIVMETHLHLKYRSKESPPDEFPWQKASDAAPQLPGTDSPAQA